MRHLLIIMGLVCVVTVYGQAIPVEIQLTVTNGDTAYTLLRGGEPMFIKGGCEYNYPERLAEAGGNSIRTYNINSETLGKLEEANNIGVPILLGLPMNTAANFDYSDENRVENLIANIRTWVETYKDSPGLLAWCIGNEIEPGNVNDDVWRVVNRISQMIHEVDGNHPTTIATAGISRDKADKIANLCPDLDILGVNVYAPIASVPSVIANSQWRKPYWVLEWGINIPVETTRNLWGSLNEPNSSHKASIIRNRYESAILADNNSLGSYVFIWASTKNEGIPTWFPLFVDSKDTEMVDEMQFVWSGSYPANRSPRIISASLAEETPTSNILLENPFGVTMTVEAEDPEGGELEYDFVIRPEFTNDGIQSGTGRYLNGLPDIITSVEGNTVTFDLNEDMNRKEFRMYAFVTDDDDNVGYWSIPFSVDIDPGFIGSDQEVIAHQDAYVRDGFYEDKTVGKTDALKLQTKWSVQEGFNRKAFISFRTDDIGANTSNTYLEVYGEGAKDVAVTLSAFSNTYWTEDELTWENARTDNLTTIGTIVTDTICGKYYEWLVGDFLKSLDASDTLVTFVLSSDTDYVGDPITWASKETVFNAPKLNFQGGPLSAALEIPITIYPNPAVEKVHLRGNDILSASIYNLMGQQVKTVRSFDRPISIMDLENGVYLVKIQKRDGSILSQKLIKK